MSIKPNNSQDSPPRLGATIQVCPECDGLGYITIDLMYCWGDGYGEQGNEYRCSTCEGKGEISILDSTRSTI